MTSRLDAGASARRRGRRVPAEVLGQRPVLVAGPGLEGGDELGLVDQPVLQRQQAEEQVARWIGVRRHGGQLLVETSVVFNYDEVPPIMGGQRSGRA